MRILLAAFLLISLGVTGAPVAAQDIPTIPDPVPVAVDRDTTALFVMDIQESNCTSRPACVESLPAITNLLSWARAEGLFVVHAGNNLRPEAMPRPGEPVVVSSADKFYNTDLHEILQERGIRTLVLAGTSANGAVLYTSFSATSRGYTIVVAEDGISSTVEFQTFLTRYQLLNQPGSGNPDNEPLRERAVTLTRSDLLSVQ
jgi:nicotinamidase-related amidase